jgi:hypothetical protein
MLVIENKLNPNSTIDRFAIKSRMNAIFYFVIILLITQLFVSNSLSVYGQAPSDTDALILMVNIERIQAQLWLTEQSLNNGNPEMAFAHAFIPHSTTFPAIKEHLVATVGEQSAGQLESLLTDLPLTRKQRKV